MIDQKVYKDSRSRLINMTPGDPKGSPDESLNSILVFIDEAFLSKLSKFFGGGKYIRFDRTKFSEYLSKKENKHLRDIYLYTAPPFQSGKPTKEETSRKEGYDKFKQKLLNNSIIVREGRCQRLKINEDFTYTQKAVDILLAIDLVSTPIKYPKVKEIILIASDSDFIPAIKFLEEQNIKTVLYTFFEKKRKKEFSTSNELIKSVYKYKLIKKEDLLECRID
jgi:uncharacterized LabA/DUF88 family protein